MRNTCGYDIEARWCYVGADCKNGNWGYLVSQQFVREQHIPLLRLRAIVINIRFITLHAEVEIHHPEKLLQTPMSAKNSLIRLILK